jgi:hypothetical protein
VLLGRNRQPVLAQGTGETLGEKGPGLSTTAGRDVFDSDSGSPEEITGASREDE